MLSRFFEISLGSRLLNDRSSIRFSVWLSVLLSIFVPVIGLAAPNAPSNLTVTETYTSGTDRLSVGLAYQDNSADETGFLLERSYDGGPFQQVKTVNMDVTGVYDKGDVNVLAVYRIRAVNADGTSAYATSAPFVTIDAPTRLALSALSTSSIQLSWRDNGLDETGLKIKRSDDGGATFNVIATVPRGTTSYTDSKLPLGKRYYYKVCAYTAKGDSIPTDTLSIAPGLVPEPPVSVAAVVTYTPPATTARDVLISFKDDSITEDGFHIYRSIDRSNWQLLNTIAASTVANRSFLDRNLEVGTTYYYRVAAYNSIGDSSFVEQIVSIPNLPPTGTKILYVSDRAAGEETGASWADCWALNSINWPAVKPGTTLIVNGGPTGGVLDYAAALSIGTSGTSNNPIVIQTAKDSGHNGRVKLTGIDFSSRSWITIDGSKNPNFVPNNTQDIIQNINLEASNPFGTGVYASGSPQGLRILWTDVHDTGSSHGIWINATGGSMSDVEIGYCHVHDNWQDGINASSGGQQAYGATQIHHCIVEGNGDDGIQWPSGVDIYNNIIRKRQLGLGSGHPDGIQGTQGYYRIYDNEISDFSNGCIFIETWGQQAGNILVYNNVFFTDELTNSLLRAVNINATALGSSANHWDSVAWNEIIIVNNLMFNLPNYPAIDLSKASTVGQLTGTNLRIQNNVLYQCMTANLTGLPVIIGVEGSPKDILFDNNIVAGLNRRIAYAGNTYLDAEALNAATGFLRNSSKTPKFVSYSNQNLHLTVDDSVARGRGANLSSLVSLAPGINEDFGGIGRPTTSAWDIGPYQTSSTTVQKPPVPSDFRISR